MDEDDGEINQVFCLRTASSSVKIPARKCPGFVGFFRYLHYKKLRRKFLSMENNKNTHVILTKPKVINVGLEIFAKELTSQGFDVTHLDWTPPAGGDPELASLLAKLTS